MKKLYFFIVLITSLTMTAQNDVTFSVDMNGYGTSFTTVYVSGEFNGWSGTANPLVDMGSGIWSATISLADGEYQYKFNHDDWAGQEGFTVGDVCTVTDQGFSNRILVVNGAAQTLSTPLFSTCYANGASAGGPHDTTFIIDMNAYGSAFTTIYISGTFNGWSGDANPMVDMGSGIWQATISLTENQHEFKFSHDNWTGQENFADGAVGTVTNGGFTNRFINVYGAESKSYVWEAEGSTVLSTEEFNTASFKTYPNPTKNSWNVVTDNVTINAVQVYDIAGRQVGTSTPNAITATIDGSALKAGIYFAKIQTNKGESSVKLIKN